MDRSITEFTEETINSSKLHRVLLPSIFLVTFLRKMVQSQPSFLGIEGCHVIITGAAGGIGTAAVKEFLGSNVPVLTSVP
jgi:FlaA1/EpsC-like NDP-sugar epimerase